MKLLKRIFKKLREVHSSALSEPSAFFQSSVSPSTSASTSPSVIDRSIGKPHIKVTGVATLKGGEK